MKRIITLLVVVALLAVIVPAGLGCTETPSEFEASGTMETIAYLEDPNPKIENSELTMRNTQSWEFHGSQEGVSVTDYIIVFDTTTGSYTIDGMGTFTGTVNGKSGSHFCNIAGSGQLTSPTTSEGTSESTIISGTGELANLRGSLHGEFRSDETGMTGTYSGTLRFEE